MSKPAAKPKRPSKKSAIVEVVAEAGDHVEPPPPEVLEPNPDLSAEEIEQIVCVSRTQLEILGSLWKKADDRFNQIIHLGFLGLAAPAVRTALEKRHSTSP